MNKKKLMLMFGISLSVMSVVLAGVFVLQSFDFSFTVEEPLSIEYLWLEFGADCKRSSNYTSFTGTVDPGRTIYPGNNEAICFKINSLSNGRIPLFVNYTAGSSVESYTLEFPSEIKQGDNYGNLNFTIAPDAAGSFSGNIVFGRGN